MPMKIFFSTFGLTLFGACAVILSQLLKLKDEENFLTKQNGCNGTSITLSETLFRLKRPLPGRDDMATAQ